MVRRTEWPCIEFLVLGAQKCATSWLYYCLRDHPELHVPPSKRESNYLGGQAFRERGPEWYFSLLAGAGDYQKAGAVSVEYLFDPLAAAAVGEYAPRAKLVVSLRDPIDRALSAYYWYVRKGTIDRVMSVDEVARWLIDVAERGSPGGPEAGWDPAVDMLERGFYDVQLARYMEVCGPERMLIVLYEDVRRTPRAVLRRVYRFLDVEPSVVPGSLKKRPKQTSYRGSMIRLERLAPGSRLMSGLTNRANQFIHAAGLGGSRPRVARALLNQLREIYAPHVVRTERIIGTVGASQALDMVPLGSRWSNFA